MSKNFWIGSNELLIVFKNGTFNVIEEYEGYDTVFTGSYTGCLDYCENRQIEYAESVIG